MAKASFKDSKVEVIPAAGGAAVEVCVESWSYDIQTDQIEAKTTCNSGQTEYIEDFQSLSWEFEMFFDDTDNWYDSPNLTTGGYQLKFYANENDILPLLEIAAVTVTSHSTSASAGGAIKQTWSGNAGAGGWTLIDYST